MLEHAKSLKTSYPTLAGFQTRALENDGGGRAIILLHGFSDLADTWRGVIDELTRSNRRAVAVDLPGFGDADAPWDGRLFPQYDAFVAAVVGRWTHDGLPPVIVGNSLGGLLAMRAAQDANVSLGGVVLVSPAGLVHSWRVRLFQSLHKFNPLLFTPIVPMPLYRALAARSFSYLAGGGEPVDEAYAHHFAQQFASPADVPRVFATVPRLVSELPYRWNGEISVRSLVLWGRHDRLTKLAGADLLRPLLAEGTVSVLHDCGHCPQLQLPDVVARHIADFADGLNRRDESWDAGSATNAEA